MGKNATGFIQSDQFLSLYIMRNDPGWCAGMLLLALKTRNLLSSAFMRNGWSKYSLAPDPTHKKPKSIDCVHTGGSHKYRGQRLWLGFKIWHFLHSEVKRSTGRTDLQSVWTPGSNGTSWSEEPQRSSPWRPPPQHCCHRDCTHPRQTAKGKYYYTQRFT